MDKVELAHVVAYGTVRTYNEILLNPQHPHAQHALITQRLSVCHLETLYYLVQPHWPSSLP